MKKVRLVQGTEGSRCCFRKAQMVLFVLLIPLLVASSGSASEIPLTWDPSADVVAGYKVYYGTNSRSLKYSVDVGDETETVLDLTLPRKKHYFAVTAYDDEGNESDFSNRITWPIYLVSPNGNDPLTPGSTSTIEWDAASEAVNFKLFYSTNNGGKWILIEDDLTGAKSYEWTVPALTNNTTKGLVKVVGYDYRGKKVGEDSSDAPFAIEVVNLTSPNGGEVLTSGQSRTISWETHGTKKAVARVQLSYTINGKKWIPIITLDNNPGSYSWSVPALKGSKVQTRCKVKVVLKDAKGATLGSDTSDAFFTIQPSS